jgi:flavodoxin
MINILLIMKSEKIAIIYKTIYGSTKKYAKWLNESVKSDVFEMDSINVDLLKDYKTIIVMSGTYGGKIPFVSFLKNNWNLVKNKKIIAVALGAAPMNHWWSRVTYFFVPSFIKKKINYFKIYGKFKDKGENIKKKNLDLIINYVKK